MARKKLKALIDVLAFMDGGSIVLYLSLSLRHCFFAKSGVNILCDRNL
jgi:hypothetical protein